MVDVMKLWDGLFACDPTLELALWVCVAMLIRVRNECTFSTLMALASYWFPSDSVYTVIPADYNGQLTVLLRYPTPPPSRLQGSVNHACLLLQQALFLQMAPTPASSASIAVENRTVLGIPIEVPAQADVRQQRRPQMPPRQQSGFAQKTALSSSSSNGEGPSRLGHSRQASSPALGLPEMLARGLLERGESLGINKTLYSAVTELKVRERVCWKLSAGESINMRTEKHSGPCGFSHEVADYK